MILQKKNVQPLVHSLYNMWKFGVNPLIAFGGVCEITDTQNTDRQTDLSNYGIDKKFK